MPPARPDHIACLGEMPADDDIGGLDELLVDELGRPGGEALQPLLNLLQCRPTLSEQLLASGAFIERDLIDKEVTAVLGHLLKCP